MKNNGSQINGLGENSDGYSVEELLSAVSKEQYDRLVGFARFRLRAATNSRWLQQCLAATDPSDLVHEAIFKLLLGEDNPSLGRHLKSRNRVSMDAFLACVKGVISSDLYNLVHEARNRHEHVFIGDPEQEPGAVELAEPRDTYRMISRKDEHRVFFKKLYQRIENQPALLEVVRQWEERSLDDDRIGDGCLNRDLVCRVRQVAREVIADLGAKLSPRLDDGEGMSL